MRLTIDELKNSPISLDYISFSLADIFVLINREITLTAYFIYLQSSLLEM